MAVSLGSKLGPYEILRAGWARSITPTVLDLSQCGHQGPAIQFSVSDNVVKEEGEPSAMSKPSHRICTLHDTGFGVGTKRHEDFLA